MLAAGGIATRDDVQRALAAGADGVRVGTRFVAAEESGAHPGYVDALIRASATQTVLGTSFGYDWPDAPHRVLASCITAAAAVDGDTAASFASMPVHIWSSMPPTRECDGNVEAMALYAGESVGAVRARVPAAEIVAELFG